MATPSLAMIPSGYKEEKLYSFLPTNGDGDFTFSRGSNATRVNKDGLIETVPLDLGSEMVTNGTFNTANDWTLNSNWGISGGTANADGTSSDPMFQNGVVASGKSYKVTYTLSNFTQGSVYVDLGLGGIGATRTSAGTYTETIVAGSSNTRFYLRGSGNFIVSIDNISVKEEIGFNKPRLDYTDSSCPSLLLEPTSTNLIGYSQSSSGIGWNNFNSITDNDGISPDGTNNAIEIDADNGDMLDYYESAGTSIAVTFSAFFKAGSNDVVEINTNSTGSEVYVGFNLTIGTITHTSGSTYLDSSIKDYGNGWYRCSVTSTSGTGSFVSRIKSLSTGTFKLFGIQFEEQSYPTSYIPTTNGIVATRLQDECTDAGNEQVINSTEGVLYFEAKALADDGTNRSISISDGTSSNKITLKFDNTSNQIEYDVIVGSVVQVGIDRTITDTTNYNKIACKWELNSFSLWVNGVEIGTDSSGSTPIGLSELAFDNGNGGSAFYGKCKDLRVYDVALTDQELADLTS
jgi:hypothetical protein